MADTLPNLSSVYAKWEKRQPFTGLGNTSQNQNDRISNTPGRQAWVAKFGRDLQMPERRRRRREKVPLVDSFQVDTVGEFKVSPTIFPDNKYRRPFMGRACGHCVPTSRNNLFLESTTPNLGVRDILRVPTETSDNNVFVRSLCHVIYAYRRNAFYKYPDVSIAVMTNQRVMEAIRKTALDQIGDEESDTKRFVKVMKESSKKAKNVLKKMKAGISVTLIRFTGWFLLKVLGHLLSTVQVHEGQMQMVKKAAESKLPLIYLPMHKSHLDYILLTFILFNYEIVAPHVAAGDNLNIPFFGWLMKGLGGFFIRRRLDLYEGKKDYIYRAVLQIYMQELIRNGQSLEFFIEGGRSRNGKAIRPKGGLLSIVVDTVMSGHVQDVYIVPVSISYEKLLDGDFQREQLGHPKSKESFWKAVKGIWRVFKSNFGSVRVDFAQPFSLQEYIQSYQDSYNRRTTLPPSSTSPGDKTSPEANEAISKLCGSASSLYGTDVVIEDQRQMVNELAEHSIHNAVHCQAVMSTHLVAFLLLSKFRQGVSLKKMVPVFDWLKEEINLRGRDLGFVGKTEDVLRYSFEILGEQLVTVVETETKPNGVVYKEPSLEIRPSTALPGMLQMFYYSNNVISIFVLESVIASSICAVCSIEFSNLNLLQGNDVTVSKLKVLGKSMWLCELMFYEFTFAPPCADMDQEIAECIEKFVTSEILCVEESTMDYMGRDAGWVNRVGKNVAWDEGDSDEEYGDIDATYQLNISWDVAMERLEFLRNIVAPFIESYWIVCCQLVKLLPGDMPESDFLQLTQQFAVERVDSGVASFAEGAAHETLKNGLKALQRLNVVNAYVCADVKMLSLGDKFNKEEALMELLSTLEEYRP